MSRVHHSMAPLNRTGLKHLCVGLHETVAGASSPMCALLWGHLRLVPTKRWLVPAGGDLTGTRRELSLPERKAVPNGVARLSLEVPAYRARKLGGTEARTPAAPRLPSAYGSAPDAGPAADPECAKTWKLVRKPARRMRFALGNRLIACSRWRYAMEKREASSVPWIRPTCRCSAKSPRSTRTGFFDFTEHSGSTGGSSD
jgi:hypothetical protein